MTIHTIGTSGVTLFLDAEDFTQMGLDQSALDESQARHLLCKTLRNMGVHTDLREISAFMGKGGVMLVASLEDNSPHSWIFYTLPSVDAFLDVWQLSTSQLCRFYRLQDAYCIALCEELTAPTLLAEMPEFGVRLYRPQQFLVYLEEHGQRLA